MTSDPTSFFRLNEEIAIELQRVERAGHFTRLLELPGTANVELYVTSARPAEGLEELIGSLRARTGPSQASVATSRALSPEDETDGCGAPDPGALDVVRAELADTSGGWDHEGSLAARSRFTIVLPNGEAREDYMPDHMCPACYNEHGNVIDSCSRVCGACKFAW